MHQNSFFADRRLKPTTATSPVTGRQPLPPTIKIRTVKRTVAPVSSIQQYPHPTSSSAPSTSRAATSAQLKPPLSRLPAQPRKEFELKKPVEGKKITQPKKPVERNIPVAKRRPDPPVARQIKKARWTGGSGAKARLPTRLADCLTATERDSCSSLQSEDRSECVSTAPDPDSTDEEDDDKEARTQLLDRYNRIVPRNVSRSPSGFSSSHPLLSSSTLYSTVTSAEALVAQDRGRFKHWFGPGEGPWPFKKGEDPKIELVYPAGGQETFPLLVPKEKVDEYRPLDDILNVVTTSLGQYLTPEQSLQFFSEPHPIFSPSSTATNPMHVFRFLNRPSCIRPNRSSADLESAQQPDMSFLAGEPNLSQTPLIKSLAKAIRRQNGSEFIRLVGWYNRVMLHLINQGLIAAQIEQMKGLKMNIWETVLGQAYERQIGPRIELVKNYATWSSNVYGELKPKFVSDLVHLVGLAPGQVFVDLGSGVGNIVMQVVLEAGCVGVGFENMTSCCILADEQMREVVGRCKNLWGVSLGHPLLLEADFTADERVGHWLKQADVVLVNNQVFTPSLNECLSLLFLDLKDSAKIISLKPFVSKKISERNMNSPLAILNQAKEMNYGPASVSWTDSGGKFYLTEVDRSRLIKFQHTVADAHRA